MSNLVMDRFIDAPPAVVFEFLVDPQKMLQWLGMAGEIEPVVGGALRLDMTGTDTMEGSYIEITPPTRVVFTWGWADQTDVPPGSSTVTVNLGPEGAGTRLTLTHAGLPGGADDAHAAGWTYFLSRYRAAATGGTPGPVSLDDLSDTTTILQE